MSLLRKLERFVGAAPAPASASNSEQPADGALRAALDDLRQKVGSRPESRPEPDPGWSIAERTFEDAFAAIRSHPLPGGTAWSVPSQLSGGHAHGHLRLDEALRADYN